MAGNNSIQFLRGTSAQRATHTEPSLEGQPIFETDTNRLYVGDGTTTVANLTPIRVADADHATTADSATNATNAQNATNATYAAGNNTKTLDERLASLENLMTVVKTGDEWKEQNLVLLPGQFGYDTTNKITKIGDGTTAWANLNIVETKPKPKPTFADSDWATISELSETGQAQTFFSVGDEKTISLTTGEQVTLVILGFDHDDLTGGGKAGMTIGMKNLLETTYRMNATGTNAGGWDESEMRTSTMATLLSQLPSDLQGVIKQVNKKATTGGGSTNITTSADKLWLLANVEVTGTTGTGYADEGEQYEYWKTVKDGASATDRVKYLSNGNGSRYSWWMRSPYRANNNTMSFFMVQSTGSMDPMNASQPKGVYFGFCV